jgi:hypothetical protein
VDFILPTNMWFVHSMPRKIPEAVKSTHTSSNQRSFSFEFQLGHEAALEEREWLRNPSIHQPMHLRE